MGSRQATRIRSPRNRSAHPRDTGSLCAISVCRRSARLGPRLAWAFSSVPVHPTRSPPANRPRRSLRHPVVRQRAASHRSFRSSRPLTRDVVEEYHENTQSQQIQPQLAAPAPPGRYHGLLIPSQVQPRTRSFRGPARVPAPVTALVASIGIEPEQPQRALVRSPPVGTAQAPKLARWANRRERPRMYAGEHGSEKERFRSSSRRGTWGRRNHRGILLA